MSFFSKLFTSSESLIECPRCLGKGHVDVDDIKRLNKKLKWLPGKCAYCNGAGRVTTKIKDNVPVDTTYLSTDLPEHETQMLINGHPDAWERALTYDEQMNDFISQIYYLHFNAGLAAFKIAEFYLLSKKDDDSYKQELTELTEDIENMLAIKGKEN